MAPQAQSQRGQTQSALQAEEQAQPEQPETTAAGQESSRKAQIRERFQNGESRGDIAKDLNLRYQTVYQYTKDLTGSGGSGNDRRSPEVEYNGETMTRAQAVKAMAAEGKSVGEIAKELDVKYNQVYGIVKRMVNRGELAEFPRVHGEAEGDTGDDVEVEEESVEEEEETISDDLLEEEAEEDESGN